MTGFEPRTSGAILIVNEALGMLFVHCLKLFYLGANQFFLKIIGFVFSKNPSVHVCCDLSMEITPNSNFKRLKNRPVVNLTF